MDEVGDRKNFLTWLESQCGAEVASEIAAFTVEDALKQLPTHIVTPDDDAQLSNKDEPKEVIEKKTKDMRRLLEEMTIPQKIKAAMFGNSVCRKLLIFNPNRIIQECVLNNAKLTIPELEELVRNTSMDSQILRIISSRSAWMRSYKIKLGIVTNPKSPPDLSLKWLKFLNVSDVKQLARSKNIPQVLQVAAKKRVDEESK